MSVACVSWRRSVLLGWRPKASVDPPWMAGRTPARGASSRTRWINGSIKAGYSARVLPQNRQSSWAKDAAPRDGGSRSGGTPGRGLAEPLDQTPIAVPQIGRKIPAGLTLQRGVTSRLPPAETNAPLGRGVQRPPRGEVQPLPPPASRRPPPLCGEGVRWAVTSPRSCSPPRLGEGSDRPRAGSLAPHSAGCAATPPQRGEADESERHSFASRSPRVTPHSGGRDDCAGGGGVAELAAGAVLLPGAGWRGRFGRR